MMAVDVVPRRKQDEWIHTLQLPPIIAFVTARTTAGDEIVAQVGALKYGGRWHYRWFDSNSSKSVCVMLWKPLGT